MMKVGLAVAACVAMAGCSSGMARLGTYGYELADAKTRVEGREFTLWVHPKDSTIAIQRATPAVLGQTFVEGATFNIANLKEAEPMWRAAATWLLDPPGCEIVHLYELERTSYEAEYRCPDGVSLRDLMMANRASLRSGVPLPTTAP